MRISRRTSGGRGEYEVSEATRSGRTPANLAGRRLDLDLGRGIVLNTGTTLRVQGGKPRLRRLKGTKMQLHLQFAAALMLPHPVREDEALGAGAPVVQRNRYAVERIDLSDAQLLNGGVARLATQRAILQNRTYAAEEFSVSDRLAQVQRVWKRALSFPDPIPGLIAEHRDLVRAGGPLPPRAEKVIYELQSAVAEESADLGVLYTQNTDVLPAMIQFLDGIAAEPPIHPEEIEPEAIEIKRRIARQWRQWASCRGAASAKFSRDVRAAYNSTCIVCGLRFPKTPLNNAGVDSAHILPWAKYEMDHVSNGFCACKLHHWAFDERLLRITHQGGRYFVEIPDEVAQGLAGAGFALEALEQHVGEIPAQRLPRDPSKRPNPKFLVALAELVD